MVNVLSGGADASAFHSFRLVLGEVARSVAAYAGAGVYLDVALGWVAGGVATARSSCATRARSAARATPARTCSRTSGGWC